MLASWTAGEQAGPDERCVCSADPAEQEKMELLEGIREGLRAGGVRTAVSLRLLRRLASPAG